MRCSHFLFLAIGLLLLLACKGESNNDNEEDIVVSASSQSYFSSGLSFLGSQAGGLQTAKIVFTAKQDWRASVRETKSISWLKVEPEKGAAGKIEMTVTADHNLEVEGRKSEIIIQSGSSSKSILVSQAGNTIVFDEKPVVEIVQTADFFYAPAFTGAKEFQIVQWGDGTREVYSTGMTHQYQSGGTSYHISLLSGNAETCSFSSLEGLKSVDFSKF